MQDWRTDAQTKRVLLSPQEHMRLGSLGPGTLMS